MTHPTIASHLEISRAVLIEAVRRAPEYMPAVDQRDAELKDLRDALAELLAENSALHMRVEWLTNQLKAVGHA